MSKPAFCICKTKGADLLHSIIPIHSTYIQNFKPLSIFCVCEGNSKDRFCRVAAHLTSNGSMRKSCMVLIQSLVVKKRVFGVSDPVQHKPGCTATEDG